MRVQEMDHFVAAVATPKIEVLLKGHDGNIVKAPEANDIGNPCGLVYTRCAPAKKLLYTGRFWPYRGFPVLIDSSYVQKDPTF